MLDPEIESKIDKLWNMFWSGGLSNPLTAIEQMSYLIFMKRLEDLDNVHRSYAEAKGQKYKSILQNDDCRWSQWKHMNAEAMFKHVNEVVFPFIKNLHNGEDVLYSQYMHDATFMIPKASLLQEAVSLIDEIEIGAQSSQHNRQSDGDAVLLHGLFSGFRMLKKVNQRGRREAGD